MHKTIFSSLAAVTLAVSCTPPTEPVAPKQTAVRAAAEAAVVTVSALHVKVTAPMAGEPPAAALKETRLVSASCDDGEELAKKQIAKMHAQLDAELRYWHDAQPDCWSMYSQPQRARGNMWGDAIGDSFGAGGLGLSGTGYGGGGRGEGIGLGTVGTIGYGGGGLPRRARSASGTNNQIANVDEADIVKTDGRYVYLAANGALRIVEAMSPRVLSVTKVPGSVRNMFIEGDRAVVYSSSSAHTQSCTYGYSCRFAGDGSSTRVSVFDVSNRQKPKLVRKIEMSGSLMASRRIGTAVHSVFADGDTARPRYAVWPKDLPICGTLEEKVRARFKELRRENEEKIRQSAGTMASMKDNGVRKSLCDNAMKTVHDRGRAYTTIMSFDMSRDGQPAKTTLIQSRPGAVFASADALYMSVVKNKYSSKDWYSFYSSVHEVSEIHKFRIGRDIAKTAYVGSGAVPGHVLNQFSMDERQGYLRIATTKGQVPDPKVQSELSVLAESEGGNLVRVGAIKGIAPGEDIRSVRFDGERGYVVTFKKTDPLFVLDLAHPAKPKILGELKIPGFSTYMHRIDAGHLLSIGFDADDQGSFAYFDGIILQLFDVTKPTKPRLIHKTKIGTRGSSSEAATNHLAFNYLGQRGLLAVPMTECSGGGGNGRYGKLKFSGLDIYRVSVKDGFERLGRIDHGKAGADCSTWWSNARSQVKRSLFLDELVYSIAMDKVKVQRMGQFGEDVATLSLLP